MDLSRLRNRRSYTTNLPDSSSCLIRVVTRKELTFMPSLHLLQKCFSIGCLLQIMCSPEFGFSCSLQIREYVDLLSLYYADSPNGAPRRTFRIVLTFCSRVLTDPCLMGNQLLEQGDTFGNAKSGTTQRVKHAGIYPNSN